jgi:quercetin dioxygenase-like cupin family protein
MIKRAEEMVNIFNENMRGGDGTVHIIRYVEPEEYNGTAKMIAKLIFKPGCSIGVHMHEGEEEIICISKGSAEYNDNGTMVTLNEGDSCVCLGGQEHGIKNASETEDLEVFAVILLY